ncbi:MULTISPECIES: DUF1254 domain-containing protein [Halocynthiibacter]|uniref:DUF1254 domain-containing protein n=1 Tax=Halocynthiibacter halioticoli TaxID=2986804 RepID=A0AAE3LUT8_9RHOB|nr:MULTISPECIES: DUF1254 domain-containing protein [Halocynthiibacter]MCV6825780.1 DUF1254 domain-containing protein [Halocynthiibacter halioticoli]MCW4058781.1 DUF1254 domain-containing protein [Halocynthiibacter sp. SDUM655004]
MLYNYQTLYNQTQDAMDAGYIGGFSEYRHYSHPYSPKDTDIVTPNNDTTYSWAWLDLRREPIVFETPDLDEGRYNVFQWVDLYTHVFASPGSRLNGDEGKTFLFVGPDWDGDVPDSIDEVLKSETDFVGTLTRTSIVGVDDIPAVKAIQHGYRFTPLSAYVGKKPPAPAPEPNFPVWHGALAQSPAFITYLNFLLGHVDPHPDDAEALASFEAIGISPGAVFDASALDKETHDAIQSGIDAALKRLEDRTATNKDNIGLFGSRAYLGTDYESRAVGAMIGIYGQNEEEAVYFSYSADTDGNPLDGSKTYTMKFDQQPEVSEFWSLTMYNLPQRLLVDNEIDRYSIGDRTEGLVTDGDGLTITLGPDDPGEGQNWLPTPDGPFFMVMRMYGPGQSVVEGTWPRPEPGLSSN